MHYHSYVVFLKPPNHSLVYSRFALQPLDNVFLESHIPPHQQQLIPTCLIGYTINLKHRIRQLSIATATSFPDLPLLCLFCRPQQIESLDRNKQEIIGLKISSQHTKHPWL
ncbi:hypothetical protein K7432_012121 [Basidiobolus ranarum]|uniref:Uncharacterized protein n=1 Tax=Basidiobolus ranarum TaxID=34480 RepID=A0ABR2WL90_9FUNG